MASNKKKWGNDLTKLLVSLYELQPVLYKINSPIYHNKVLRSKALESIKAELETVFKTTFTTDEILKKINNLRTQFLDAHRNHLKIGPSGAGAEDANTPTWWLYESLQFLTPYYKKDKGKSNLNNQAIPEIDENEFELESNTTDTDTVILCRNLSEGVYTIDSGGILSPSSSTASIARVNSSLTHKDGQRSKQQRNNKRKRVSNATTLVSEAIEKIVNEESDLPADIASFCNYVGHELLTVKHKDVLTRNILKPFEHVVTTVDTKKARILLLADSYRRNSSELLKNSLAQSKFEVCGLFKLNAKFDDVVSDVDALIASALNVEIAIVTKPVGSKQVDCTTFDILACKCIRVDGDMQAMCEHWYYGIKRYIVFYSLSIKKKEQYLKNMETAGTILLSDNSNYSDSEDDDWIPNATSQSALDEEISNIDFNVEKRESKAEDKQEESSNDSDVTKSRDLEGYSTTLCYSITLC
ncbi:hypothetical protein FQA39_LY17954 [Lamprigera yunnana]|nr:hypothetical protein FQA39_LY17954 [Lamprigera yunnana]